MRAMSHPILDNQVRHSCHWLVCLRITLENGPARLGSLSHTASARPRMSLSAGIFNHASLSSTYLAGQANHVKKLLLNPCVQGT